MPVSPIEMFESAKLMTDATGDESYQRSCISRLYYSGYHAAKEFHCKLSTPGNQAPDGGSHENFVHQLAHPSIPETDKSHDVSIELAQYLKKGLLNRRLADYRINEVVNDRNVSIVKTQTQLIFDTI